MSALGEYSAETPAFFEVEDPAAYVRKDTADAAIESLKCCGNCHWSYVGAGDIWCGKFDATVPMKEPCVFAPPHWRESK